MVSLVEHGRIKTTIAKAKELRRHIERIITLGKKDNLNAIRLIASRLANQDAAVDMVKSIAPRFKDRPGGYTRLIKVGRRPGDAAEMAFIEFVDYDYKSKMPVTEKKGATKKEDKVAAKVASKVKKISALQLSKDKKVVRKMKNKSRAANQAAARA